MNRIFGIMVQVLLGIDFKEVWNKSRRGLFLLVAVFLVPGLGAAALQNKSETVQLRYQGWASQVLLPELAEDLGYLKPLKLKWIGNTISGPQDIQAVASGDIDFGGAFAGAIVNLKAAKAPIKWVIGYYGADDKTTHSLVLLQDSPIKNGRDLIGKTIGVNTLAAHHEFIIKEYLRRQGLTEAEIKQVSLIVIPPVNAEQVLRQKQVDGVVLGGYIKDKALERGGVRELFADAKLFGPFTGGGYVFREKYIAQHPKVVRKFVEANAKALEWSRNTPREKVVARFQKIIRKRKRNEDASLVSYWKSFGVAGKGGLTTDAEVQRWIDFLVKEGKLAPGAVKPADVYTNEFNPYRQTLK